MYGLGLADLSQLPGSHGTSKRGRRRRGALVDTVAAEGRLVLDCGDQTVAVSAGDIIHLRPLDKSGL